MTYWKLSTIIILKYIFAEGESVVRVPNPLQASGNLRSEFTDVEWIHLKSGKALEPSIYTECAQDQSRYCLDTRGLSDYWLLLGEWRVSVEPKPL